MHIDIPTDEQITALLEVREPGCVSIYLPTSPLPQDANAARIEFKNLAAEAARQLGAPSDHLDDLHDDEEFWALLAHSLAVFADRDRVRTFRLPNHLAPMVEVSDRFHLKPLLRSVTFPQAALVLALAQGQKVRMRQYARLIDTALRPVVAGLGLPLILAATEPLDAIYRSVNSYPGLAARGIGGNPEGMSDGQLADAARAILDELYSAELDDVRATFETRADAGRSATDVTDVARAATFGAVDTLLVDIDDVIAGHVDDEGGAVTRDGDDDASNYGVVDEIARRVLLSGGRVLALRRDDIPERGPVAAILRYPV